MKTRMYYAESRGFSEPYVDLWRFKNKKERDEFVSSSSDNHNAIRSKSARLEHKEQFIYWKQEDQKKQGT